jgi:hypothetical protein
MPFTNEALDKYVAQGMSQLTACDAPDLSTSFKERQHWIHNFILNSMFRASVKPSAKPLIFSILRRAQMSIAEYEAGRLALKQYIDGHRERWSVYFDALYRFELAIALACQGYEAIRKLAPTLKYYDSNDGTPIQRLFAIYNISKHLEPTSITDGHLHAVWLTNDGVSTSRAAVTWAELAELLKDLGEMANDVSDPLTLKQKRTQSAPDP